MSQQRIETICVQGGYTPGNGEPRQIPIIQSTTFKYATSEDMGKLFDLEASGYFYTRLQNPTNDHVAAKIAALEGGTAGHADRRPARRRISLRCSILPPAGTTSWLPPAIYGGTFNLISVTMAKMGIDLHICCARLYGGRAGRGVPSQYQGRLWRDHRQPRADRAGY